MKEQIIIDTIKATLVGKINGFERGISILDPEQSRETIDKAKFTIRELEEVLATLNRMNSEVAG